MAQLFTLKLTDNNEMADFMGGTYLVMDGGFDISLPRMKRELVQQRPGFYIPIITEMEYRESKLRFEIRGATRSAVIASLNKIERILRSVASRERIGAGRRGELSYAWEGALQITYFEVYGGDIAFPQDVLSVAKVHRQIDGSYALPEVEVTLYMSAEGFGVSVYSNTLTEVPLMNGSIGSKTTGGVKVTNPGPGLYNYVEIDGVDLPGSQPLIMRLQLASDTPYSNWQMLYIGLQAYPFPTKIQFEDVELVNSPGGTVITSAAASGGRYIETTYAATGTPWYDYFADWAWSVSNPSKGVFHAFLHCFNGIPTNLHYAIGIDDYVTYGIRYKEEYVQNTSNALRTLALGSIQLPPSELELADFGTLHGDLWMGIFMAGEGTLAVLTLDQLSLLPIANGIRILRARSTALTGTMYDDDWSGLTYTKDGAGKVYNNLYGLMEPLKLEPNTNQRLYFTSIGDAAVDAERTRTFKVRVYVVPTYSTLAM